MASNDEAGFVKRQPDYRLYATDKKSKARSMLGAAWVNGQGMISIHLGPCVSITSGDGFYLSLASRAEAEP